MTNSYVQVPPDSTGKKLASLQHTIGGHTVQTQLLHVTDPVDPTHMQFVDARGQAFTRFAEGSPSMNAFGALRVSTGKVIGVYDFTTDSADDLFSDNIVTGGSINYLSASSTISLDVTTVNGASATRTSDKYHFYWPGNSNLYLMTVAHSNAGVVGNIREWGMLDDNDGAHFAVIDNSLNVVLRSSVTGSIVETVVAQADWNVDKLDGTGTSAFLLDVTKVNIYWIDYQWLGGGLVHLGIIDGLGNRVICHTFRNANSSIAPYIRTGTLPLRVSNRNTALTGSGSSIRLTCAAVHTEGELNYTYWRYSYPSNTVNVTGNNIPIITLKSVPVWNGKHNVTTAFPETLTCVVVGGTIRLDIYWDDMDLTGSTYALDNGSTVIADVAATATTITTQQIMQSFYFDTNMHVVDLSKFFEVNDVAINSRADEANPLQISFIATKLTGTPTINASINYRELR